MTKSKGKYQKQLEDLYEDLAESVWALTDAEIEREAQESGVDLMLEAMRSKERMLFDCKQFRQRKLLDARAQFRDKASALRSLPKRVSPTPKHREMFWAALSSNPQFQSVTARFRNLNEVSDEDFESMTNQLIQLGLIDPKIFEE